MNKIRLPKIYGQPEQFPDNIFLVGGAVRDILLGKEISDFDFVCKCNKEDFYKIGENFFKKIFKIKPFLIGKEFPPTLRGVKNKNIIIDLTLLVDDFFIDAKRRDFTINAIYLNLKDGEIIDPLNGKKDIENKKIKVCSKSSFKDDPLRLLRAIRFLGYLEDFTLDKFTYNLLKSDADLIIFSAKERIKEELDKIIVQKKRYFLLMLLEKLSILSKIIPRYKKENFIYIRKINETYSDFEKIIFVYSLLLPEDFSKNALIKFSNKEKKIIKFLINNIKIIEKINNEKDIKKFILKYYEFIPFLIKLCEIVCLERNFESLKKNYKEFLKKRNFIFSIIDGNDIIKQGIKEGKIIGEIIEKIRLLAFDEIIKNRKDAINYIKNLKNE